MCKYSKTLVLTVVFFLSFVFCSKVKAVSITINSFPATIDSLDPYSVSASISGATNATNYLRADLYKDGTTNYFGETYNGSDWYSGTTGKNYYPTTIQNSSASATIYFELGNPSVGDYPGPGAYKLKIGRYTSSGNSAVSTDLQTPVDIQINYTFAADTPSPTSAPTPDPTQVPATPPPRTSNPAPAPTKTPTPKPTQSPVGTSLNASDSSRILGMEVSNSGNILATGFYDLTSPTPASTSQFFNKTIILPAVLIVSGVLFIGFAIYNVISEKRKNTSSN